MIDHNSSYSVSISIAGDLHTARESLRRQCVESGLCVSLVAQTFIYTHGAEEGVRVGFVNYPRFPKNESEILKRAIEVATRLMVDLCQRTALIETPEQTYWLHEPTHGG